MRRVLMLFSVTLASAGLLLALPGTGLTQSRTGWPRSVTIGSATIGGVYFVAAGGYAKMISDKMGLPATNRVTGGPVQNVQLVQNKEIELGMTTTGPAFEGRPPADAWRRSTSSDAA